MDHRPCRDHGVLYYHCLPLCTPVAICTNMQHPHSITVSQPSHVAHRYRGRLLRAPSASVARPSALVGRSGFQRLQQPAMPCKRSTMTKTHATARQQQLQQQEQQRKPDYETERRRSVELTNEQWSKLDMIKFCNTNNLSEADKQIQYSLQCQSP